MLGPAEADALGAELARLRGVLRGVGVRAHAQAPNVVGPLEDRPEVLVDRRRNEWDGTHDDSPCAAVDGDHVTGAEIVLADAHRARGDVDREVLAPCHARLTHPASDNGGMRGHAAAGRQDAGCTDEAVDVVRRGLQADEDHVFARSAALLGRIRVEHDRSRRRAGRCVQPAGSDLDRRVGIDHRVEQLIELSRVDPRDSLLAGDEPFVDHLGGHAQRRGRGALAGARLQKVERAFLDRELDVLQVAVVGLEPFERVDELVERLRHPLAHPLDRLRRANPGDDVLPLRVREELAVEPPLTGGWVTREAHTGP